MDVLVIGGTRFFGIPMIEKLIKNGHNVTIATRGLTSDHFGNKIKRRIIDIYNPESVRKGIGGEKYDAVVDKMGYGSLDIASILDNVECEKIIHMSTAGVYKLDHLDIKESEYDPKLVSLDWCTRGQRDYDYLKKMAEASLVQRYADVQSISVRSPFVLGENDYTNRFRFYIDHIKKQLPMYIDNLDESICFANAVELGKFMAVLIEENISGPINFCSKGTISLSSIVEYVERKTHTKAILSSNGEPAPYNGTKTNSLNVDKAEKVFGQISDVTEWIYPLIDIFLSEEK